MKLHTVQTNEAPPLISAATFARSIGRTSITVWRWQKLSWLDPFVNIAGKPYLTREAIERWNTRARAGEFAKAPHAPKKEKAGAR